MIVNLRSCNTLQAALEVIEKQRPFDGKALKPDELSLSTTIPSLGISTSSISSFNITEAVHHPSQCC